jgi:hypothetical protein
VSLFAVPWLLALSTGPAQAQEVIWERIIGIHQTGDLVGKGTGQVTGGAPWETTDGQAQVNLTTRKIRFEVDGLVLAVGSVGATHGLDIGTPVGVTKVKGTLVCDVNGSAGSGNSVLVDTPAVALSEPDIAFLIRIVAPAAVANRWIAAGAVRIP